MTSFRGFFLDISHEEIRSVLIGSIPDFSFRGSGRSADCRLGKRETALSSLFPGRKNLSVVVRILDAFLQINKKTPRVMNAADQEPYR